FQVRYWAVLDWTTHFVRDCLLGKCVKNVYTFLQLFQMIANGQYAMSKLGRLSKYSAWLFIFRFALRNGFLCPHRSQWAISQPPAAYSADRGPHPLAVRGLAVGPPEGEFIGVFRQVLAADMVPGTHDTTLEQA